MRSPSGRRQVAESISKGKALLNAYRTAAIDYVNFHWYIQDPRALEEAVAFLRARTGLAVITNEIGQPDRSSKTVTALLDKVLKLELPVAIWSSVDRPQARALQDPDGRWRENGLAAKSFLWRRLP